MPKSPNSPSPYYQPESSVDLMKIRILRHLELMKMPTEAASTHASVCSKDCHVIERNHTLESVRQYIQGSVDKSN